MGESKRPTLNQLATLIAERAGRVYDLDFIEEVKVMIHYWRQRLLVDSLNSKPEDREFFKVWFDMEMEDASISDYEGFPESSCVKRSKLCLPNPVRANSTIVDFLGYLNKATRIPLVKSVAIANALEGGRYSKGQARAVLINNRIYTINFGGPAISVAMIPEDMTQVPSGHYDCIDCGSNTDLCYTDDLPYPVSGDIAQRIVQAILATELNRNIVDEKTEQTPIANERK